MDELSKQSLYAGIFRSDEEKVDVRLPAITRSMMFGLSWITISESGRRKVSFFLLTILFAYCIYLNSIFFMDECNNMTGWRKTSDLLLVLYAHNESSQYFG